MGSDSSSTNSTKYYINNYWIDGSYGGEAKVYVKSRRVEAYFGVHHFIACDVSSNDKWIVFEWMNYGRDFYECESLNAGTCCYLGRFNMSDVYDAVKKASDYYSYSSDYNCNHWTEKVASNLGINIKVHWNCACVL